MNFNYLNCISNLNLYFKTFFVKKINNSTNLVLIYNQQYKTFKSLDNLKK